MFRPTYQKKLREIANKHDISLATAEEVVKIQWSFLRQLISTIKPAEEYYPMMGVKHLGKFVITERRKWAFKHKVFKDDTRRHEVLQPSGGMSGNTETNTPEALQG